jgi:hypothetical protein
LIMVGCSLIAGSATSKPLGPDYEKLKALLPPGPDAAFCFAQTYDAEHLSKHPQQKVTELILFIRYITLGEDEAHLVATDDGGHGEAIFRLRLHACGQGQGPKPHALCQRRLHVGRGHRLRGRL